MTTAKLKEANEIQTAIRTSESSLISVNALEKNNGTLRLHCTDVSMFISKELYIKLIPIIKEHYTSRIRLDNIKFDNL